MSNQWTDPEKRALHDPLWLRRSYRRCLWDGGATADTGELCSAECAEALAGWETWVVTFDEERHIVEAGAADDALMPFDATIRRS